MAEAFGPAERRQRGKRARRCMIAYLHNLGREAAQSDFYYIPLEHVARLDEETGREWDTRIRARERWWIHALDTTYARGRGWNIEHTAAVLFDKLVQSMINHRITPR